MSTVSLLGCANDSLLGYLKGLGVLRIMSQQGDRRTEARWNGTTLEVRSSLSEDALLSLLIHRYAPTPILNPWNGSTGFDGKSNDRASLLLERVRQTAGERWAEFRDTIAVLDELDLPTLGKRLKKGEIFTLLRSRLPDAALAWLDAVVAVSDDEPTYATLLGSGGNDGRLDFSVNFIERALEMIGEPQDKDAGSLLNDSLFGTSTAKNRDRAIGQFSLRHTGGANATAGFSGGSLVNPWDFILMMEGALLFSGGLIHRSPLDEGRPSFPFSFRSLAAGYGSASPEEKTRGEVWLPIWFGWAGTFAIRRLLRDGRLDTVSVHGSRVAPHSAENALEAAEAAMTYGFQAGLERFQRIVIAQRNGLAFGATEVGSIYVSDRTEIRDLSAAVRFWLGQVRRNKALSEQPGCAKALNEYDGALIRYASLRPGSTQMRAQALQDILCALASLDRAVARSLGDRGEIRPIPTIPSTLWAGLDLERSIEHRLATAYGALGWNHTDDRLRPDIFPLERDGKGWRYGIRPRVGWIAGDIPTTLLQIASHRARVSRSLGRPAFVTNAGLAAEDLAGIADGVEPLDMERLGRLIEAYALIDPPKSRPEQSDIRLGLLPAPFAVLRLAIDNQNAQPDRVLALLAADRPAEALDFAYNRLRILDDLPGTPRDVRRARLDITGPAIVALSSPMSTTRYHSLLRAALRDIPSDKALTHYIESLVQSNSTGKER